MDAATTWARTGGVADDSETWRAEVHAAAIGGHQDELARLYVDAATVFGDDAAAEWARTLSALDANAVTG